MPKLSPEQPNEFEENAGYYIYLYLLFKGFPKERIIMRTANASGKAESQNLVAKWDKKFNDAAIKPPEAVQKGNEDAVFIEKLGKLYDDTNEYYKIRQCFSDAVSYWKDEINKYDKSEFVDNLIINKSIKNDDKKITKTVLLDMLEIAFKLFPVQKPQDVQDVYLSILKHLAIPFEAVKTYNLKQDDKIFLNVMKLMRNWFAHDKFEKNSTKPTYEEFIALFIIALRAFFSVCNDTNEIHEYEKLLLNSNDKQLNEFDKTLPLLCWKVYNCYKNIYDLIDNKILLLDYNKMLNKLGFETKSLCTYQYLIQSVWVQIVPLQIKFIENTLPKNGIPIYLNFNGKIKTRYNKFIASLFYATNTDSDPAKYDMVKLIHHNKK